MFLLVLLSMSYILNSSHEPTSSSSDELCALALTTFMQRTDSDLAKYIRPHLATVIKEATSSPESEDESPSPIRTIKRWVTAPEAIRNGPAQELDEVVLKAVQKAFEEKDKEIAVVASRVENMFSKRTVACITTGVTSVFTLISALAGVFATKNNC